MAYPVSLDISYSYTGFASGLGDGSFPGSQLDNDLANVETSIDSINAFLSASFASDGRLKPRANPNAADLAAYVDTATGAAATATTQAAAASTSATSAASSVAAVLAAAAVVQVAYAETGASATTTTTIPNDDTIPQITEGAEFLTCAITPQSATNYLLVRAEIQCSPSVSANLIAALFRDSTASALAVSFAAGSGGSEVRKLTIQYRAVAGSTAATTFRLRAGMGSAGTMTVNGAAGARLFGGAANTSITVTEIKG